MHFFVNKKVDINIVAMLYAITRKKIIFYYIMTVFIIAFKVSKGQ